MDVRAAVAYAAGKPLAGEYTLSGADAEGLFPAILGHEGAGIVKVDLTRRPTLKHLPNRLPRVT
jgi:hypothetical protein